MFFAILPGGNHANDTVSVGIPHQMLGRHIEPERGTVLAGVAVHRLNNLLGRKYMSTRLAHAGADRQFPWFQSHFLHPVVLHFGCVDKSMDDSRIIEIFTELHHVRFEKSFRIFGDVVFLLEICTRDRVHRRADQRRSAGESIFFKNDSFQILFTGGAGCG